MNNSLLAGRYAKALLAHAENRGQAVALYPVMEQLVRVAMGPTELNLLLGNPMVSVATKRTLLQEAVSAEGDTQVVLGEFFDLVFAHRREKYLGQMALAYRELYRQHHGIVKAKLITAEPFDGDAEERLWNMVAERTGRIVERESHVNPNIEGGFVLQVDDQLLDASLKGQLDKIRKALVRKNKTIV